MASSLQVAVLGSGSWGTALAHHLRTKGHEVTLWGRNAAILQKLSTTGENEQYFPGLKVAKGITFETDLKKALAKAKLVVVAVPSGATRALATQICPLLNPDSILVSTAKGLEDDSLKSMSSVIAESCGGIERVVVLSGPSFAREVLEGMPTVVTIAGAKQEAVQLAAEAFHNERFRIYTSLDVNGVEYGGVIKNVIALAIGALDGMGMGLNARAALITRGVAEMQRLIVALGGQPQTVFGLSGLGDLLLTATGELSRNRQVGFRLGKGEELQDILSSLGQTAEAVTTTGKVYQLARKENVRTPIIDEVHAILSGANGIQESVSRLLGGAPRSEHH